MVFRMMIHSLSFLLPNMFKTGSFMLKYPKVSKFVHKFLKLRGKFPKLKRETRNSRTKLKLWEDFTPPERPSDVIKKA